MKSLYQRKTIKSTNFRKFWRFFFKIGSDKNRKAESIRAWNTLYKIWTAETCIQVKTNKQALLIFEKRKMSRACLLG